MISGDRLAAPWDVVVV